MSGAAIGKNENCVRGDGAIWMGDDIFMKEINFEPLRSTRLRICALAAAMALALALGMPECRDLPEAQPVSAALDEGRLLIPGGKSVGIAIETEGIVLVGTSDLGAEASPARLAGLKGGDIITRVNGEPVGNAQELAALLKAGEAASVTVLRNDREKTVSLTPIADPRDGAARIGAWVRSSTAGVGTLSFIDPETGLFGALGHAISDVDTGVLLPVEDGGLYESRIVRVHRGERGVPGELVGDFLTDERQIGEIRQNGLTGIYGLYTAADTGDLLYPDGLPVAVSDEVHVGAAQILTTVDEAIRAYDIQIEQVDGGGSDLRAIVLHVTDPALIEKTGGIVQGMSGSPIIQDGKIVGAVTHVLVNDPTRGYGIFIENMLDAAG